MLDSPSGPQNPPSISFSFFVSLVRGLSQLKPLSNKDRARARPKKGKTWGPEYPALDVFKRWVIGLRERFSPLPPGTTAICFRLLFPEEDWQRKYGLQEARLTGLLADCYGWGPERLEGWRNEESSGCLGDELKHALQRTCPTVDGYISEISLAQVSDLLDQLAALCHYSDKSITAKKGLLKAKDIIRKLFRPLSPLDAAVMVQVILKDLRPLLYPLTEFHYTTALVNFNTASVKMLTKEHAMNAWDPSRLLGRYYRMRASLDAAAAFADDPKNTGSDVKPACRHPIAVPKSEKGQSCTHALKLLSNAEWVWAETKYDGERAQIHVIMREDGTSEVCIFSKSKRNSTKDRAAVHGIIREALGLDEKASGPPRRKLEFKKTIILDAEMVAFSGDKVTEFWHIRRLIQSNSSRNDKTSRRSRPDTDDDTDAEERTVLPDAAGTSTPTISLGLVFFDILYLDGRSQMGVPYDERRARLEEIIHVSPGRAILASRWLLPMYNMTVAEDTLRWVFAHHIASHEEGLVLKASESCYNDYSLPWVKLKKDYIPGHGDTVDMAIIGASWEKVRGRSLRVPPSAYTTFLVGALENKHEMHKPWFKPSFAAYFTVSYGLDRIQLEDLNFRIKGSSISYQQYQKQASLKTNTLCIDDIPNELRPTVVLCEPFLVELFGAGFSKAVNHSYYELRFPRISKIYRSLERGWREGLSFDELTDIARESVGRDPKALEEANLGRAAFQQPLLPGIKSKALYEQRMLCAYNELATSEDKTLCAESFPTIIPEYSVEGVEACLSQDLIENTLLRGGPLFSKTNIMEGEAERSSQSLETPSFDDIAPCLQLTIPAPLLTLPHSTPNQQIQAIDKVARPMDLLSNPAMPLTPPPSSPILCPDESLKRSTPPAPLAAERPGKRVKIEHVDAAAAMQAPLLPPAGCSTCSPPDIHLDSTLVYLGKPNAAACASLRASRRLVPQPVHSMYSMLYGSGWVDPAVEVRRDMEKAVIVIDECNGGSAAYHWRELRGLLEKEAEMAPKTRRLEVLVYGCRSAEVLARYV